MKFHSEETIKFIHTALPSMVSYFLPLDVFGILWHCLGFLLQVTLFVSNLKWRWWTRIDNELMFKLVEIFKLVALFVLLLNPSSVLDYSCHVPPELASLQIIPYVAREGDVPFCADQHFLPQLNLTSEQESLYKELCNIFLDSNTLYVYGTLIAVEIINIIYFFICRNEILSRPWVSICALFPSGMLWATYELISKIRWGGGYRCDIQFLEVLTRFLSITNFFMTNLVIIYMFSLKRKFVTKLEQA